MRVRGQLVRLKRDCRDSARLADAMRGQRLAGAGVHRGTSLQVRQPKVALAVTAVYRLQKAKQPWILGYGHGLSIGSEGSGGVQNVHVARVHFKGTANGVRIKSNRDRGGEIGNFDFRDLTMEDVATPILITEYYPHIPDHDSAQPVPRTRWISRT